MAALARCRSCGRFVRWATTAKNRKPIMLDPEPNDFGSIVLEPPNDVVIRTDDRLVAIAISMRRPARAGERRYLPHFASCPDAKHWRQSAPDPMLASPKLILAVLTPERNHR